MRCGVHRSSLVRFTEAEKEADFAGHRQDRKYRITPAGRLVARRGGPGAARTNWATNVPPVNQLPLLAPLNRTSPKRITVKKKGVSLGPECRVLRVNTKHLSLWS